MCKVVFIGGLMFGVWNIWRLECAGSRGYTGSEFLYLLENSMLRDTVMHCHV